jgi:hypothetical protein
MTSVTVASTNGGACDGLIASPPASILVSWSADRFDPTLHTFKVYENDVLKSSQTSTTYAKTIAGNVEFSDFASWVSDWTYRVDVVDAAGIVLSSMSSDAWQIPYGSCRPTRLL